MTNESTQDALELTRVVDLAEVICKELGYSGKGDPNHAVDYAFRCVNVQNEVLSAGRKQEVQLFHPDRPLPFIHGDFNEGQVTGELRLDADGVHKMRAKFLAKPPGTTRSSASDVSTETADRRQERLLLEFEEESRVQKRGALARVSARVGLRRQTVSQHLKQAGVRRKDANSPIAMMARIVKKR